MKSLFTVIASLLFIASAQAVEIRITSFQNIGNPQTTRGAEVCGIVTGMEGDMVPLKVTTDYNSSSASDYVTFTTPRGLYCTVIQTYLGRVEVSLASNRGAEVASAKADSFLSK